ncbi:ATP-binding protein [Dongia sp.]|uniref:ATP-binding protein n=1 Tax=Dongia sp. TaxID=1977262 RepID=UPI0035B15BA0
MIEILRHITGNVRRPILDYAVAILMVGLAGFLSWGLERALGTESLPMVLLTSVLLSAVLFGRNAALIAAFLAIFTYNFLLVQPRFTMAPADNLVTLGVFLAVAVVTGGLAGRVRDQARAAAWRARITTNLFEASRELSRSSDQEIVAESLATLTAQAANGPVFVFLRGEAGLSLHSSARADATQTEAATQLAEAHWQRLLASPPPKDEPPASESFFIFVLHAVRGPLGLLICRKRSRFDPRSGADQQTLSVLADLGSIALERAHLMQEMTAAKVVAETERLRTALLSSISHDFRTPLATILASSTSLLRHGAQFDEATSQRLILGIKDQADRLNRYVRNLLDIIRIESGGLAVKLEPTDPADVANAAIERVRPQLGGRVLDSDFAPEVTLIQADPLLLEQVFVNILENAIHYSPEGSHILLGIGGDADTVEITVTDSGKGIPPAQLDSVFEKFYRGSNDGQHPRGTGLGLSICRGLTEAMQGRIWAESPASNGIGTRIHIAFPSISSTS